MKRWNKDEIARVAKLRDEGLKSHEIAPQFGVSPAAIRSVLSDSHLCRRTRTDGYLSDFYTGPAIARCPTQERLIQNAIDGSARLRDAILRCAA